MAITQATSGLLPRLTMMASTMIGWTPEGRIDVKRVAREMAPIIGALALAAASTVIWVQAAPKADAPSASFISTPNGSTRIIRQ